MPFLIKAQICNPQQNYSIMVPYLGTRSSKNFIAARKSHKAFSTGLKMSYVKKRQPGKTALILQRKSNLDGTKLSTGGLFGYVLAFL